MNNETLRKVRTKHKRRSSSVILAIIVTVVVAGALAWLYQQRKPIAGNGSNPATVNFRIKFSIYSGFAPHFVALEKGYYDKQGLKVDIQPGGPGIDPLKIVLTGDADVGLASYDQILLARERGLPLIAIGEDTTKSGVGFISLVSSGIKTPKDFIGRKVGVMPGTDKGTVYEALMSKLGIDRSKIQEIPVQFNLAVLFNGTVEVFPAFISNQPIIAQDNGFEVNVIDPDQYGITPGGNVFFTSEETLRKKRDVLEAFLRAELGAIMDSQSMNDGEVVDCVIKHNNQLKRDTEIKIWQATKALILPKDRSTVGIMPRARWEHTAQLFKQAGLLKSAPDFDKAYTNALVEDIHKRGF
jgi:ABC-type nitrate/sulfonate/bicarbonate transport system substrate-binding protein